MKHRTSALPIPLRGAVVACAAVLLAGCAGTFGMGSTKLDARITAAATVNPDDSGRASPVVVRVYELKNSDAFQKADFFSLYDKGSSTLGRDQNGSEELELRPGESQTVRRKLLPDTQYIGVLAAFREIDRARWRAVYQLRPRKTNAVTIRLDRDAVSIVKR